MKQLLAAVIMLGLFSGVAVAQGSKRETLVNGNHFAEQGIKKESLADLAEIISQSLALAFAKSSEEELNVLAEKNSEFAEIKNLYTVIKTYWPDVRRSIAEQKDGNKSFVFQHFTGTMDNYMKLAGLVKDFKAKKTVPSFGKVSAANYLKELAKLIDEPFEVKWSKESFITSQFIVAEASMFDRSPNYMLEINDFARMLKYYKQ